MSVSEKTKPATGVESLTNRQREILRLVARHHQTKQIARILKISEATVRTHTEEARRRLSAASSREAAIVLLRHESGGSGPDLQDFLPEDAANVQAAATAANDANPAGTVRLPTAPVPPNRGRLEIWLKRRTRLECVGVILLIALGLSFALIALVGGAATSIQAVQNLTGQTH